MERTYLPLEMETIVFQTEDIITSSDEPWEGERD
jgi:hypothetical protein